MVPSSELFLGGADICFMEEDQLANFIKRRSLSGVSKTVAVAELVAFCRAYMPVNCIKLNMKWLEINYAERGGQEVPLK